MKSRVAINDAPRDSSWWKNDGHGRRLKCPCGQVVTLYVPVAGGLCTRCRGVLELLTAPRHTADRLRRSCLTLDRKHRTQRRVPPSSQPGAHKGVP